MVRTKLHECAIKKGVVILESMGLVNGKHSPRYTAKKILVFEQNLVRCKESVELQLTVYVTPLVLTDLREKRKR